MECDGSISIIWFLKSRKHLYFYFGNQPTKMKFQQVHHQVIMKLSIKILLLGESRTYISILNPMMKYTSRSIKIIMKNSSTTGLTIDAARTWEGNWACQGTLKLKSPGKYVQEIGCIDFDPPQKKRLWATVDNVSQISEINIKNKDTKMGK